MESKKLVAVILGTAGIGYIAWEAYKHLTERGIPPPQPTPITVPSKPKPKPQPKPLPPEIKPKPTPKPTPPPPVTKPKPQPKPPTGKPSKPTKPQPPAIVLKVSKTKVNEGGIIDAYVDINRNPGVPPNYAPAMALEVGRRAVIQPFNAPLNKLPWHLHFRVHAGPVIQKYINVPAIFGLCPGDNNLCFAIHTGDKTFKSNIVRVTVIRRSEFIPTSVNANIIKVDDRRAKLHLDINMKSQPIDMPLIIEWDMPSILVGQNWMMVTRKFITVPKGRSHLSIDIVASVRDPAYPNKYHNPVEFKRHRIIIWKPCDYNKRYTKIITL